jgi:hypothetical protein
MEQATPCKACGHDRVLDVDGRCESCVYDGFYGHRVDHEVYVAYMTAPSGSVTSVRLLAQAVTPPDAIPYLLGGELL